MCKDIEMSDDGEDDVSRERFVNLLREGGYRITDQRRVICGYLAETKSHPTPSDVFSAVQRRNPSISRATVYNTLNVLRDLGGIVEISACDDHTHYDTDPTPHINLICLHCDQIADYQGELPAEALYQTIVDEIGFQPRSMQVQLMGICQRCRNAEQG